MPNDISTDVNDTWLIDASNQQWTLEDSGSISVDGTAISEDANERFNDVFIRGDIHSETTVTGSIAAVMAGYHSKIIVYDTSTIDTETGLVFDGDSANLRNEGVIHAAGTAVQNDMNLYMKNRGEITGTDTITYGDGSILNLRHGLISGTDTAITGTGDANVVNKGTISAPVAIDAPVVSLENHGKITGDIDASQVLQAQFFSGTVFKGEIEPGDFGAYITIYGGARLDSPLAGLDGNTSYTLIGKTSAVIDENENGGLDRVITTMKNYVLRDNVEDLDMGNGLYQNSPLPKSGHGIGNSLDNILAGEKMISWKVMPATIS